MIKMNRIVGPSYRPLLLTTKALYPRWRDLLWHVRVPEQKSVIVVLPQGLEKTRTSLLAIARCYQARGGAVRLIEASRGVERYYEVRDRLSGGRR
jgi:hypothetical protein